MSTLAILTRVIEITEEEIHAAIRNRLAERGRILPGEPLCEIEVVAGDQRIKKQYHFPKYVSQ